MTKTLHTIDRTQRELKTETSRLRDRNVTDDVTPLSERPPGRDFLIKMHKNSKLNNPISSLFRVYIRINANEHAPFTTTLTDFNQ